MTMAPNSYLPGDASQPRGKRPWCIEDMDLTPEGLSDTPAHQQDPESIVHTGNS
jgi:hypothetical protein